MNKNKVCSQWIINANQAKNLIEEGATVLETRFFPIWLLKHIKGSVSVSWQQFSQSKSPNKGKLLENEVELEQKLQEIGIHSDKPVIVVANSRDRFYFGEDGRIVWMLRSLGHTQVALVNGGYKALKAVGVPTSWGSSQPQPGNFQLQRTTQWEIQRDELKTLSNHTVLDTREPREYKGETPYGETRGGHISGAISLYFREFLNEDGYLLPSEQILDKLAFLKIYPETPVITYCTGGIRSAFVLAVLVHLGFKNVKNYAGSTWEWSASPATDYPLI